MTVSVVEWAFYAFTMLLVFLTPGPVWVALLARALAGGFSGVWPLALGVAIGDVLWPLLALLGISWVADDMGHVLPILKWAGAAMFLWLGVTIWRKADQNIQINQTLVRPGQFAGFLAGLVVIAGNPKAMVFYLGILPGFFDLSAITWIDIGVICFVSAAVPFFGNLCLGYAVGRLSDKFSSPTSMAKMARVSGVLLCAVGCVLPLT